MNPLPPCPARLPVHVDLALNRREAAGLMEATDILAGSRRRRAPRFCKLHQWSMLPRGEHAASRRGGLE